MPIMQTTTEGIEIQKKLDNLTSLVQTLIQQHNKTQENTREFRRKLELIISEIRESNGDIADKLDELIYDWNNL